MSTLFLYFLTGLFYEISHIKYNLLSCDICIVCILFLFLSFFITGFILLYVTESCKIQHTVMYSRIVSLVLKTIK